MFHAVFVHAGYTAAACLSDQPQTATFTSAAKMSVSGIKQDAVLDVKGLWRCGGIIPDAAAARNVCSIYTREPASLFQTCTGEVVMTYTPDPSLPAAYAQPTMAAAVITYTDGRQEMITTFDCATWQPNCHVFGHYALSWLLHDIVPGQRQVLLNMQVDDVFLETQVGRCNHDGGR
jgi:hypothetical protein